MNAVADTTCGDEDETEARTAWLLSLSADQIAQYDRTTICDWLIARDEQRIARLRAACQVLRAESRHRQQAYRRLLHALTTPAP